MFLRIIDLKIIILGSLNLCTNSHHSVIMKYSVEMGLEVRKGEYLRQEEENKAGEKTGEVVSKENDCIQNNRIK